MPERHEGDAVSFMRFQIPHERERTRGVVLTLELGLCLEGGGFTLVMNHQTKSVAGAVSVNHDSETGSSVTLPLSPNPPKDGLGDSL